MKQYRTLLTIVLTLFIGWIFLTVNTCAQVRLTSIEHSNTKWMIPVAKRVIPGQTGKYFQTYMSLQNLIDSVGILLGGGSGTVTSINTTSPLTGGPITASGTIGIQIASGSQSGAISSTDWNNFNNKFDLPSLSTGSILFSNGTTIVQDNSNFYFDNTNDRIGLGTNSPTAKLHIETSNLNDAIYIGNSSNNIGMSIDAPYFGYRMNTQFASGWARSISSYYNLSTKMAEFGAYGSGSTLTYSYLAASTRDYSNPNIYMYGDGKISVGAPSGFTQSGVSNVNGIFTVNGYSNLFNSGTDGTLQDVVYFGNTSYPSTFRNRIRSSISSNSSFSTLVFSLSSGASTYVDALTITGTKINALSLAGTGTRMITATSTGDLGFADLPITSLGGQSGASQTFATGTSGTDFNISSATNVHTFNLPSASGSNRGLVTTGTQTFAGAKTFSYLGGAPSGGNSLIVADQNGRLENLYGATINHVPKWNGTSFTLQADATGADAQNLSYTAASGALAISGGTGVTLPVATSTVRGLVPTPPNNTTQYLRADATWGTPPNTDAQNVSYTAATRALTISGGTGFTFPMATATVSGLVPTPPNNVNQFLSGTSTWVTVPTLPTGVSSNTLTYLTGAYTVSSFLKNNSSNTATGTNKRVEINNDGGGETWPLAVNTSSKFLVNGRVQMNSTSSTNPTTIMGRNADAEVGTINIGNSLAISSGSLKLSTNVVQKSNIGGGSIGWSTFTTTPATVPLGTIQLNTGEFADITDGVEVTNAGTYEITYKVNVECTTNSPEVQVIVTQNGTTFTQDLTSLVKLNAGVPTPITNTAIFTLAAGGDILVKISTISGSCDSPSLWAPSIIIKRLY